MGGVRWGFWTFIVGLVVLHFMLRIGLGLERLAPDLLLVALLLAARETRAGTAAGIGLLFGILDGSVVPYALGASALVMSVLGFLGARSRDLFGGENYPMLALYLFAGKWLFDVLLLTVTGGVLQAGAGYLLVISPLAAVYAAAAGLVGLVAYRAVT